MAVCKKCKHFSFGIKDTGNPGTMKYDHRMNAGVCDMQYDALMVLVKSENTC